MASMDSKPVSIDAPDFATLERSLLEAYARADRAALEALLAPGFREVSVSGQSVPRQDVFASLPQLPPQSFQASEFEVRRLGPHAALVTYRLLARRLADPERRSESFRSSLWERHDGAWQLTFHHATRIPQPT